MNSIHTLLTIAIALCAFMLGMTVAGYTQFTADPPEHYNIQSLEGRKEVLTGDQFTEIVEVAEALFIEEQTRGQGLALA